MMSVYLKECLAWAKILHDAKAKGQHRAMVHTRALQT